jgi:hypothetical protein
MEGENSVFPGWDQAGMVISETGAGKLGEMPGFWWIKPDFRSA